MKGAVIASGLGERLRGSGIQVPKAIVPVGGKPLIVRVLTEMHQAGLSPLAVVTREEYSDVHRVVEGLPFPVTLIRRSTPSSMESLFALEPELQDGPFFLSMVDSLYSAAMVRTFLDSKLPADGAGLLAVMPPLDDDKPLYARFDDTGRITALGESHGAYCTAGYYILTSDIFHEIGVAREKGLSSLRGFFGHLVSENYRLYARVVPPILDIDRVEDLVKAEEVVRGAAL